MWIEIGSLALAVQGGLEKMWEMLCGELKAEGVTVLKNILSRVDVYADYDVDIAEFSRRFSNGSRITRARRIGVYGESEEVAGEYSSGSRPTGFSIGGDIRLRVYDKKFEMRNDPVKKAVFGERYGNSFENLTRVEYQLRRNALKLMRVDASEPVSDVASYLRIKNSLWRYLTECWFRLTEDVVDSKHNHYTRAKTWSVWETIQKSVAHVAGKLIRLNRPKFNFEGLLKQGLGCVCKMAAYEREELTSVMDVLSHFAERVLGLGDKYCHKVLEKVYADKRMVLDRAIL